YWEGVLWEDEWEQKENLEEQSFLDLAGWLIELTIMETLQISSKELISYTDARKKTTKHGHIRIPVPVKSLGGLKTGTLYYQEKKIGDAKLSGENQIWTNPQEFFAKLTEISGIEYKSISQHLLQLKIEQKTLIENDYNTIQETLFIGEASEKVKKLNGRGINLHESISERLVCYLNNFALAINEGSYDAKSSEGDLIQIKATSNFEDDLSSFGPRSKFDFLHFARFDINKDEKELDSIVLNKKKNETFLQQQEQGRRPHFSIIKEFIEKHQLEPYKKYKVVSLFAGIGGIDLAFEQADKYAAITYRANFPNHKLVEGDIKQVKTEEIPNFDILIAGFPCQAFSVAGEQKGFNDERGKIFFEIIRFLKAKKPKAFLLENVRNLVSHNEGETLKKMLELLKDCGYWVKYDVLSAETHGNIPQNRERIFIVGFQKKKQYETFSFPLEIPLKTQIKDLVNFQEFQEKKYYYSADNHGTGGHNVPLIFTKQGIRKLTPRECFNLQGFPLTFKLPDLANCHLYKQAGNSVIVPLIKRIAENILVSIKRVKKSERIPVQSQPFSPLREQN
ncbi:29742_t:CDS:2, partial [Gigaspora margarita]